MTRKRILLMVSIAGVIALVFIYRSKSQVDPDRDNTFALLMASANAAKVGNLEDAGFLFYAAQARFEIDKQVFPPLKTAADDPGVLKAALSFSLGSAIVPHVKNDPVILPKIAARFATWSPKFDAGYNPGWEYKTPPASAAIPTVVAATKKKVADATSVKLKLLGSGEYVKLTRELAEANKIKQEYFTAVDKAKNTTLVPQKLKRNADEADKQLLAAATRIREIEWRLDPDSRWHAQVGWRAENYFVDKQVIALCHAIEQDDVKEMEQIIAAGANANAIGKDGMTPLLWAFPDGKLERFACLLEHGADPNVVIHSDFNTKSRPFHPSPDGKPILPDRGCHAGQSVTLLAARSPIVEYMKLVFDHGGNPNLLDEKTKEAPLDAAIDRYYYPTRLERVQILIDKGANLNRYCEYRKSYPAMEAVKNQNYDVALLLLKAGANPKQYQPDDVWKLIHFLLQQEPSVKNYESDRAADFHSLVKWLEQHGENVEEARNEKAIIDSKFKKAMIPEDHARIRNQIIKERELAAKTHDEGDTKGDGRQIDRQ
jgi:hypothetical protein